MAQSAPPLEGFPQFSNLPSELRRMIWNECLPAHRVVELDYPVRQAHNSVGNPVRLSWCRLKVTTAQNGRWPLISQVCREAREVVAESRCADIPPRQLGLENLACHWLQQPEGCWIRPSQDIAHLNWHPAGDYGDGSLVELPAHPDPVPWITKVANRYEAAEVSLAAAVILPFGPSQDLRLGWEAQGNAVLSLGRCRQKYLMCLQTVTIHASTAEASLVGDGLFGTLGDSPIALVDPIKDWKSIEKARVLWQTVCQTDADAASFFGQTAKLQDRVRKWSNSAKLAWLYFRWRNEVEQGALLPVGDIFTPTLSFEGNIDLAFNMGLSDHPWAAENLQQIPRLQPVIMFRLCPAKCHLEVQDPCEVDYARREALQQRVRGGGRGRGRGRGRRGLERRWWYPPRVEHEP